MSNVAPRKRRADPRRQRTHAAIHSAIGRLSHAGVPLTVPAIVAEAGVSRSTFYAQYTGLEEVLTATMTQSFADIAELDISLRASVSPTETAQATTTALVAAFAQHRVLCRGVFRSDARAVVLDALLTAFVEHATPTMTIAAPRGVDPHAAAGYVGGGTLTVLLNWVLDDEPTSSSRLQEQLLAFLPAWMLTEEGKQLS